MSIVYIISRVDFNSDNMNDDLKFMVAFRKQQDAIIHCAKAEATYDACRVVTLRYDVTAANVDIDEDTGLIYVAGSVNVDSGDVHVDAMNFDAMQDYNGDVDALQEIILI